MISPETKKMIELLRSIELNQNKIREKNLNNHIKLKKREKTASGRATSLRDRTKGKN